LCESCADEVQDLLAFRTTIASTPKHTSPPAEKPGFERLRAFWQVFAAPAPRRFATASAVALLLVSTSLALVYVWRTLRIDPEITQNPAPNKVTVPPTPTPAAIPQATPAVQPGTVTESPGPQPNVSSTPEQVSDLVLALSDSGGRVTLDSQGNLGGLDALSPAARRAVRNALVTGRLESPPDDAELRGKRGTLLGEDNSKAEFALLGPVGTVVRGERPVFRWRPLTGATSYKVTILDPDFNVVASSPPLTTNSWTPESRLARGVVYSWQVAAVESDGREVIAPSAPAPEARFKVLGLERARELMRAEKVNPRSHLARGVLYARAGLLDDAERELRALVSANPQSPAARKLLRSLQATRGKRAKARK
jgi:hypothetical protein